MNSLPELLDRCRSACKKEAGASEDEVAAKARSFIQTAEKVPSVEEELARSVKCYTELVALSQKVLLWAKETFPERQEVPKDAKQSECASGTKSAIQAIRQSYRFGAQPTSDQSSTKEMTPAPSNNNSSRNNKYVYGRKSNNSAEVSIRPLRKYIDVAGTLWSNVPTQTPTRQKRFSTSSLSETEGDVSTGQEAARLPGPTQPAHLYTVAMASADNGNVAAEASP